ncbi:MAG: hypothetical protein ABIR20_04460 [Lysobacter sp.]
MSEQPHPPACRSPSDEACAGRSLNSGCYCVTLDPEALRAVLQSQLQNLDLFSLIEERCPYLFASRPVFITPVQRDRMALVIRTVEAVVALPGYRDAALEWAPDIARDDSGGARGVFFGYDFHIAEDAFGLIEINTNAGGAMLNIALARAQRACCPALQHLSDAADAMEAEIIAMFNNEWSLSGRTGPLRRIAIVDEAPQQQYLYQDFLLFQELFQRHGFEAVIADPSELTLRDGTLWHGDTAIDLVYNRLTDFALQERSSAVLREAYRTHAMVLTPHPQAHALYADKRNLALLTDTEKLRSMGVSAADRDVLLAGIPHTEFIDPADAERLWSQRRKLFFKPAGGFGSRAAYRGDKLTRRVWQEILAGDYVAQALVAPGQRRISSQLPVQALKFDLRNYVYQGAVQWLAGRLYQGQTTNFRTPGGGFAPVYVQPTGADGAMAAPSPKQ